MCAMEKVAISKPTHLQRKCKGEIPIWNPKKHQHNTIKKDQRTTIKHNKRMLTSNKG
jgi:hypothetical protein